MPLYVKGNEFIKTIAEETLEETAEDTTIEARL